MGLIIPEPLALEQMRNCNMAFAWPTLMAKFLMWLSVLDALAMYD